MKRPSIFLIIFMIALATMIYLAFQLSSVVSPEPAGFLAADKGYGVTIDLTLYSDDTTLSNTLTALHRHGLTWVRQPIRWAELETAPGRFDWQQTDRILAAIVRENGLIKQPEDMSRPVKLIAVLQTTPFWARAPHTPASAPPAHLSDFGAFVHAFAARYGEVIDHYQIWHEPNLSANWGNTFVEPLAYADMLREAALNIRTADSKALVLTAALAPTLENGPLNLNELDYLDQLYQAKANRWFDIVAGQAYGFDSEPFDFARTDTLNFSRLELIRQVMLRYGDGHTPVWSTAFGWNALPAAWAGPKSPWKSDPPSVQAQRTAHAIVRARREWPWLGPMLAVRWDTTNLAIDDPARGFALRETPQVLTAIQQWATGPPVATPGAYPANNPTGQYSPGWRFALSKADIPPATPATLTIPFEGTRLDLTVDRGPYRGYLWVTIDGQPAHALPRDHQGRSYIVLYDPLRESERVTLARGLAPGSHQAVIRADGGWGQWAINGWEVYQEDNTGFLQRRLILAGLLVVLSGLGLGWSSVRFPTKATGQFSGWSRALTTWYTSFGKIKQILIVFILAIGFYIGPDWLKIPLLVPLILAILLRPDHGLILIAFSLSFLSTPIPLPIIHLSTLELVLLVTATGLIFKNLRFQRTVYSNPAPVVVRSLASADGAALTLLTLALLATLFAANFGVSMYEWRMVVLASVTFYFLVRFSLNSRPSLWRLIDAFVAGAVLQASLALYSYFFGDQYISAEGVRRAVGTFYESPNHLALFLGRAWPILLAVSISSGVVALRGRLYRLGLVVVSLAIFLTFSKGALLLGLPASTGVIALLVARHARDRSRFWVLATAVGGLAVLMLALMPLNQTVRFSPILDMGQGGTGFFRLKLWQASLNMFRDHWLLGVGLDNFLYQYRTTYILPEAWQEPNLSHPHNLVLDFGTRLGWGGIVVLLWLQTAFWRQAWQLFTKRPDPLIIGLMGSMVVFLSHGLVDNAYFLVDLALTFFLMAGIVQQLGNQKA